MIKIIRTNALDPNFRLLVNKLDSELAVIDGDDHAFYHQYNGIDNIKYAIVILEGDNAVSCGAIKEFDNKSMEIKRMYTLPDYRGKGLASRVLKALEEWASELGYKTLLLETGKRQRDAVALYTNRGYNTIPNYGQYVGIDNSVCFSKFLK